MTTKKYPSRVILLDPSYVSYAARHQSERDVPSISVFIKGLSKVETLKAREKHARLFALYSCLLNSHCIEVILNGKKYVAGLPLTDVKLIFNVIEMSLIVHSWLNSESIPKAHIISEDNTSEPMATCALKSYMRSMKKLALLTDFNLIRPKFHQLLHFIHYIQEFGVPKNFDGSRCESFGKEIFKHSAVHTQMSKPTFNFDTASRIYERKVIEAVCKLYQNDTGKKISKYSTPVLNCDAITQPLDSIAHQVFGAKFTLQFQGNLIENMNETILEKNMKLQWKNKSNNGKSFPLSTMLMVQQKLFLNPQKHGGIIDHDSVVNGFTEYRHTEKKFIGPILIIATLENGLTGLS